jgi:hypothetical protein
VNPGSDDDADVYVPVGSRRFLDQFLAEYKLTEADVRGKVVVQKPERMVLGPGRVGPKQYAVHDSLLRSHGEFPCAGDAEALRFCRRIAEEMARVFGIGRDEAIARINREWSEPAEGGRTPRIWMVGLDIAYHETAEYWAYTIYYGKDSGWWRPDANPEPRPAPK